VKRSLLAAAPEAEPSGYADEPSSRLSAPSRASRNKEGLTTIVARFIALVGVPE
jgi:hypothetical protein